MEVEDAQSRSCPTRRGEQKERRGERVWKGDDELEGWIGGSGMYAHAREVKLST